MDKQGKIILVQGAAGQQGGATARHLLKQGWQVRALTRDPNKPAAQALAAAGAHMVQADNEDRAALEAAMQGVYGVFSVQNFWLPGVGAEGEIRQGKLIADVARAAGVRHFVYTSVGGADRRTGIPHFESKWQIEEYARSLGLPLTVLRPVAFMDNYNWNRADILNRGVFFGFGLRPDKTVQLIAADDIGGIATAVFDMPERWIGQAVEIAGDELTEPQIAEAFAGVIGRPVQIGQMPYDPNTPPDPEMIKMGTWFNEKGYIADIAAVRAIYPALQDFDTWLRRNGWENAPPRPEQQAQSWR
jgi:uncharacterized protein YbjT (DUF2867 family)